MLLIVHFTVLEQLRWSDVLAFFRENENPPPSPSMPKYYLDHRMKRGYLHVLFRYHLNGPAPGTAHTATRHTTRNNHTTEDEAKLEITRSLVRSSMSITRHDQHHMYQTKTILSEQDESGNCPIHYLFGNVPHDNGISYSHIWAVMDLCNEIDTSSSYWLDLLRIQNCNGCTPLHFLAEQCEEEIIHEEQVFEVVRILERMNAIWMDDSTRRSSVQIHPLMIQDHEGGVALNNLCALDEWDTRLLEPFLGIVVDDHDNDNDDGANSKETFPYKYMDTFDTVFNVHNHRLPVFDVLDNFLLNKSLTLDFYSHDGENNYDYYIFANDLWPKVAVLLDAAVRSNIYCHGHDYDQDMNLSSMVLLPRRQYPIHLAACVETFPTFVLMIALMIHQHQHSPSTRIDDFDDKGRIPLHYAITMKTRNGFRLNVRSSSLAEPQQQIEEREVVQVQSDSDSEQEGDIHAGSQEMICWRSDHEPRSMVQYLLDQSPKTVLIRDDFGNGRLPLHLAIVHGRDLNYVIKPLLQLAPEAVSHSDTVTNLKPFMLAAATGSTCSTSNRSMLDVVYHLLLTDPSMLASDF